ncbi:hypothetical protein NIES4102_26670 [Chondrocystis sp. NIES-4102]|nr:hypothetical protein NIES4102_26670 [Chondrocystis sp. NIES-4102]
MSDKLKILSRRKLQKLSSVSTGILLALMFSGCETQQSQQYEATAKATMTWRVKYAQNLQEDKPGNSRYQTFESVSLINRNGEKPDGAVYQDNQGIWWPKEPPKPSIDEIEAAKKKSYEKTGTPERLRQVEYRVKFFQDGEQINLPTNYDVYRQVSKAYPDTPLNFTMGVNNGSVTKATPMNN